MRFYPYDARIGPVLYIKCVKLLYMREVKFSFLTAVVPAVLLATACGGADAPGAPRSTATAAPQPSASPPPSTPAATPAPATATPSPGVTDVPTGFPLDPRAAADRVTGASGSRVIEPGTGPSIREAAALQATDDPARANASGWNCRVHVAYEGTPAVDWYVQEGTPVYATIDGDAALIVNTVVNAFDYYGVGREPYLGDPDRARAPIVPFPGPGGGMGVYVAVTGVEFRTDYGHLAIGPTLAAVPARAFTAPYSRSFDYAATFATPQRFDAGAQVASWRVRKGDIIGYTGDAGYSEAPHLHYTITRRATGERLCPTGEAGFADNGWLTR